MSSVSTAIASAELALKSLRAASEPPGLKSVGIGNWTALCRVAETATLSARVPMSYVEDGSALSDHIINDPVALAIDGRVGDIVIRPNLFALIEARAQAQIATLASYLPQRSLATLQKVQGLKNSIENQLRKVQSVLDQGAQLLGFLRNPSGLGDASLQQSFCLWIEYIYESKGLISIEMPWRTYHNMALTSIALTRDNQDRAISFSITAQEVRIAKSKTTVTRANDGIKNEIVPPANKGQQPGKKT